MQPYQEARPMQYHPPAISAQDVIGAPVVGSILSLGSFIGARLLSGAGYLPPLAAEVVGSTALLALLTGGTGALATVLGFWLKFRRQTVENLTLEEQAMQAERTAIQNERAAILAELRSELDARKTESNNRLSIIAARDLAIEERDATIRALNQSLIEKDKALQEKDHQLNLMHGILTDKQRNAAGGDD